MTVHHIETPLATDDMRDKAALYRAMADDFDAIDRIERSPRFGNLRNGGNMPPQPDNRAIHRLFWLCALAALGVIVAQIGGWI
jgi:hypothetical protein